ncbi:hypothetical protein [Bosea sp. 685]|uniref:hypothetical protein n=1 Tax=Bosea sp. 685 TaxID=3080057 RepID=UPI002892FEE3|nr:hypothetical protein [Bosea sp. 685]WNJ93024.1 hypothetical protein RMR04_12340 [Bosea sp. 685]
MAKINFSGWYFEKGIKSLMRSFDTAGAAILRECDKALTEQSDYEKFLDDGGELECECDGDGFILWDKQTALQIEVASLKDAAISLRKAFAIQLYHHWERSAQGWTGSAANARHEDLVAKARVKGLPIDDRLDVVRMLANTLKHGSPHYGRKLLTAWPEILAIPNPAATAIDWYAAVTLSDAQVKEVATIVAGSGPKCTIDDLDL